VSQIVKEDDFSINSKTDKYITNSRYDGVKMWIKGVMYAWHKGLYATTNCDKICYNCKK